MIVCTKDENIETNNLPVINLIRSINLQISWICKICNMRWNLLIYRNSQFKETDNFREVNVENSQLCA